MSNRYLYLARHAEAVEDETALSERGCAQAAALGARLAGEGRFDSVRHGPLERAARTAALVAERLGAVLPGTPVSADELCGDYVPYVPAPGEVPTRYAEFVGHFEEAADPAARARSATLAERAAERLLAAPRVGDPERRELVVTHNFLIGWLVCAALQAPPQRWVGLDSANTGLTVIHLTPDLPPRVRMVNDVSHLALPAG